jgi:hypothetical protein
MKAAITIIASLLAASPAMADPLTRLRNATANELCWDTVRGVAREKYPTVKPEDPAPASVSLTRPIEQTPAKQSRKAFDGIRNC